MSVEDRPTKDQVLMQVALDLSSKAVKLYEQGHEKAAENLTNTALDINLMVPTVRKKSKTTKASKI